MTETVLYDTVLMTFGRAVLFVEPQGRRWMVTRPDGVEELREKGYSETNMKEPGRVPMGLSFRVDSMAVTVNDKPPPPCTYFVEAHADWPFPIGHLAENASRIGPWTIPANSTFSVHVHGPKEHVARVRVFLTGSFTHAKG